MISEIKIDKKPNGERILIRVVNGKVEEYNRATESWEPENLESLRKRTFTQVEVHEVVSKEDLPKASLNELKKNKT